MSSGDRILDWRHLRPQSQCWEYLTPDPSYSILFASRQIYDEFEPILYQSHVFDFDYDLGSGMKFLKQISERARLNIGSIKIARHCWGTYGRITPVREETDSERELTDALSAGYERDWNSFCIYASKHLRLQRLKFNCCVPSVPHDVTNDAWVQSFTQIRGLQILSQGVDHLHGPWGKEDPYERDSKTLDEMQALLKHLRSKMLATNAPAVSALNLLWNFENFDWLNDEKTGWPWIDD